MIPIITAIIYKGCRICSTNHVGSTLCLIMSLIINSLGGGHTHACMHADVCTERKQMPGLTTDLDRFGRLKFWLPQKCCRQSNQCRVIDTSFTL